MFSWQELTASERFRALSGDEQEKIRQRYFDDVVLPSAPGDFAVDELRKAWDEKTSPQRSWGATAKDLAVSFGSGSGQLVEGAGTLYGLATGDMDNAARSLGKDTSEFYNRQKSAQLKAAEEQRARKVAASDGFFDEAGTAIAETVKNPALLGSFATEQIPMFVGPGVAGRVGGLVGGAAARTGSAIGAGAAMQAGDVSSDAYEQAKRIALSQGMGPEEADAAALEVARKVAPAAGAVSVASQFLPGGRTIERALSGAEGRVVGRGAGLIKGAMGEGVSEAVEEGFGKVSSNVGMQSLDPSIPLTQGAGEAAGMGMLGGVGMGGVTGFAESRRAPHGATPPPVSIGEVLDAPTLDEAVSAAERIVNEPSAPAEAISVPEAVLGMEAPIAVPEAVSGPVEPITPLQTPALEEAAPVAPTAVVPEAIAAMTDLELDQKGRLTRSEETRQAVQAETARRQTELTPEVAPELASISEAQSPELRLTPVAEEATIVPRAATPLPTPMNVPDALQRVAQATEAIRTGRPTPDALAELDGARVAAEQAGLSSIDIQRAAEGAGRVQNAPAVEGSTGTGAAASPVVSPAQPVGISVPEAVAQVPARAEAEVKVAGTLDGMADKNAAANKSAPAAADKSSGTDEATGLPLNDDGTVTLYHHTSPEAANEIRATGRLRAAAEPDAYLTTRAEPDTGYGDAAVRIRVRPERLQLDDEFPNGRRDFRLGVGKPGGETEVVVENDLPAGNSSPALNVAEDFTTRRGDLKAFSSESMARAYAAQRTNRVPSDFAPRLDEETGKWRLSRPSVPAAAAAESPAPVVQEPAPSVETTPEPVVKPARTALPVATVHDIASKVSAKWKNKPNIVVIDTMEDAPPEVRDQENAQMSQGADRKASAFFHEGKVYLVASQQQSPKQVTSDTFHEVLGHWGLQGVFGDTLHNVLREVASARRGDVEAKARQYGLDFNDSAQRLMAAEEVLAELASKRPEISFVRKAVAKIRTYLRDLGLDIDLSDDELIQNYLLPARGWVERGAPKQSAKGPKEPEQSKEPEAKAPAQMARSGESSKIIARQVPPAVLAAMAKQSAARFARASADEPLAAHGKDSLMARLGGRQLAKHVTMPVYDRILSLEQFIPDRIKAGIVSDYGLPEDYLDRRTELKIEQKKGAKKAERTIAPLTELDRSQSRVAYQWMTQNEAKGDELLAHLPEKSQATLREVKQIVTELGREAVALGQLSPESFERNKMAYLHRSYSKFEMEDTKQQQYARARAIKVLGEQYKGRGMIDQVAADSIRGPVEEGRKYVRLANLTPATEKEGGDGDKLRRAIYIPAEAPVPAKYATWRKDPMEWELRYPAKGDGKIGMWRDFTPDERKRMGELDEVRFAIAKTLMMMTRDIETGRFLQWVGEKYARASTEGIKVVATPSGQALEAFKTDEWVEVPTTKIPGTDVRSFGELAGKYIPAAMWNDIRQVASSKFNPFGEVYAAVLRGWKISKTALSPATHANNILSNFILMDLADVGIKNMYDAAKVFASAKLRKNPDAIAMLERYDESGGDLGSYAVTELQRKALEPLLDAMRKEVESKDADSGRVVGVALLSDMLRKRAAWREFGERARGSLPVKITKAAANAMIEAYQSEDQAFRFTAWLKAVNEGKSDTEAGTIAREAFLDYHISAPWIQNARATVLPFIAFSYRAAPLLLKAAAERPWKLIKYASLAGALNGLAYASLGLGGADEDRERKLLPEEKSGRIWGVFPRLMRLPWNTDDKGNATRGDGAPAFLDIRRWIPVGDIIDFGQHEPAIPVPATLFPGGPLVILAEVLLNKKAFDGKSVVLETDEPAEQAEKILDYLFKTFAPNMPLPNPIGFVGEAAGAGRGFLQTHATQNIMQAGRGATDPFGRELSVRQALENAFGVKEGSYAADTMLKNISGKLQRDIMELDMEFSKVKRQYAREGLSETEFDKEVETYVRKKEKLFATFDKKVGD